MTWTKSRKDQVLSLPLVSLIDSKVRYLLSQDNLDNIQMKYHQYYHWLAGTEVTEVQERVIPIILFYIVKAYLSDFIVDIVGFTVGT